MEVKDKAMYHYHHANMYQDMWVPNNELNIDDNFESAFLKILDCYSTAVDTINGNKNSFDNIITKYLEKVRDVETYIRLLKEARRIINESSIFIREMALEEVRKQKYSNLPSRKHSIWLCDENGLDFWKTALGRGMNNELDLYKVSVTGNLFKSSDSFIPDDYCTYENMLKVAENYWNPKFENEEQEKKAEFLFQGKIKILEKVKSNA